MTNASPCIILNVGQFLSIKRKAAIVSRKMKIPLIKKMRNEEIF